MSAKYENGIFIFRRDFRVIDNIGLNIANSMCKKIYPIFIFTPEQISGDNKFKSDNAVQFMIESLHDLSLQINKMGGNLLSFYGENNVVISHLISQLEIQAVFFNMDYTPYAIQRDTGITSLCEKMNVFLEYTHDYYLHPPGTILNGSGSPYQKFTPFYKAALQKPVISPANLIKIHFASINKKLQYSISLTDAFKKFTKINAKIMVHGGRSNAVSQMRIAAKNIKNYPHTHNDLSHSTSQLSAYIKFGCVSIREIYKVFKKQPDFIRQLFWRDFYANILYAFPHVLGSSMKPKYNKITWNRNSVWFQKWCNGETGYPVVDAGMRQLNQTGYMHNRARLIVMSFLVKTLLLDWRLGEKYFATKLTDYDPASNNGNIQWVMGGGSDSNPYFRIFNPWRQTEEYDPECDYIKKWIPELVSVPVKDIIQWDSEYIHYKETGYPKPIVDYADQKEKALDMYKTALY
jgi:deoxyribodipyrimidine photo-lyase